MESTALGEEAAAAAEVFAGMEFDRFIQLADERWIRQRKDPWCVVGEHKHWPFGELDATPTPWSPFPLFGDVETVRLLPLEAMYNAHKRELIDGVTSSLKWQRLKDIFIYIIYSVRNLCCTFYFIGWWQGWKVCA